MAAAIHVGDVGTALQYQCLDQNGDVIDVSGASAVQITFVRSDKSRFTVNASFVTNGTDGWIQYLTQAGDLSVSGLYTSQVYLAWDSSPVWNSDVSIFKVCANE